MTSEKPKQGDKFPPPYSLRQRNNEIEFIDLAKEATDTSEIFDSLPPFPYFQTPDIHGLPQHCAQEMLLPSMDSMDDTSQFKISHYPGYDHINRLNSDISCLEENVNKFSQSHGCRDYFPPANEMVVATYNKDVEKSEVEREVKSITRDVAKGLEIFREGGEANTIYIHRPWSIGDQITRGSNAPVSLQNPFRRETGLNTGPIPQTALDHSATLDGSFLNLGVGSNRDPRFISAVSSRNSTNVGAVLPQLNTVFGHKSDGGYLNPCFQMDGIFSNVQDNANGFTRALQTDGGFSSLAQEIDGFSRLAQNADGLSQSAQKLNEFPNLVQNPDGTSGSASTVGLFFHQSPSLDVASHQVHKFDRHSTLVPKFAGISSPEQDMGRFSHQAHDVSRFPIQGPNVDRISRAPQNLDNFSKLARTEDRRTRPFLVDKQQYPRIPKNCNFGLGQNQTAGFTGINPNTEFQGFQTDSLMLQNCNQAVMPGYQPCIPTGLLPSASFGGNDQLQEYRMRVAKNSISTPSLDAPFAEVMKSMTGQDHLGQEILAASASCQASDPPLQSSLKRAATESPVSPPQAQSRKSRKMIAASLAPAHLIHHRPQATQPCLAQTPPTTSAAQSTPCCSALTQNAPFSPPLAPVSHSFAHLTHPAPSHLTPSHTYHPRQSLVRAASHLPSFPRTSPSAHIKWQDADEIPPPSGRQCHICKRDLSYAPEGPVHQPMNPPPAAVLPCKHHFHAHCLELITTDNQAQDPPCIPCALGEKI